MVRNWILREGAPSITVDQGAKAVLIESRRRVSISPGNVLVLLSEGRRFTQWTQVLEVDARSPTRGDSGTAQARLTRISVEEWQTFPIPVEFDLFAASLTFVRNRQKPRLHIRPGYRSLPQNDFETIAAGEPFVAREAWYALMNALPDSMQRKFLAQELLSSTDGVERSFQERTRALIGFIQRRVLTAGAALKEVADLWHEVCDKAALPREIRAYFHTEDDAAVPDNIEMQAALFQAFQSAALQADEDGRSLLDLASERLQTSELDSTVERFERLFAGIPS
jgi:hypothetical protein